MLRLLKILFLALLGVTLVILALANRDPVTLRLLPPETGGFLGFGWAIDLPLFLVIFAGIVAGLAIGFVWEWFREAKHRAAVSQQRREMAELRHEVSQLRQTHKTPPKDDVLALLEAGGTRR